MERAHARKRKDRSVVRRVSAAVPGIVADPAARRSPLHGAQGVGLSNPRHLPEKTEEMRPLMSTTARQDLLVLPQTKGKENLERKARGPKDGRSSATFAVKRYRPTQLLQTNIVG